MLRWVESDEGAAHLVRHQEVRGVGAFDPAPQQTGARREAPRPELADQIADTVRPGYVWHGDLLRPQQVVVYVSVND